MIQLSTMSALDHSVAAEFRGQQALTMVENLQGVTMHPEVLTTRLLTVQTVFLEAQLHAALAMMKR